MSRQNDSLEQLADDVAAFLERDVPAISVEKARELRRRADQLDAHRAALAEQIADVQADLQVARRSAANEMVQRPPHEVALGPVKTLRQKLLNLEEQQHVADAAREQVEVALNNAAEVDVDGYFAAFDTLVRRGHQALLADLERIARSSERVFRELQAHAASTPVFVEGERRMIGRHFLSQLENMRAFLQQETR